MSTTSASTSWEALPAARGAIISRAQDLLTLTKPKISVMVVVAVAASAYIASLGYASWTIVLQAMFGAACLSASASAANQLWERRLDKLMARTAQRPLAAGRMSEASALVFILVLLVWGAVHLACWTTWSAAAWGVGTWLVYVLVYTPLKTRTPWNTAVGAISGAMPLLLGWTAVDGSLGIRAAALFVWLYLWQFPHFMAIAWMYRRQYGDAGMRMLSVEDAHGARTGAQAVLGAAALLPVSCLPALYLTNPGAAPCALAIVALGLGQFAVAVRFLLRRDEISARQLLRASLVYLPLALILFILQPLF